MKYEINENLGCIDIEINSIVYRIKSCNSVDLINDNALAECDFFDKEIRISPTNDAGYKLGDQKIQETVYHEMAHAWLEETGQHDINDERTVEVMSRFAMQLLVMYDNDFIDYVYKMHTKTLNK